MTKISVTLEGASVEEVQQLAYKFALGTDEVGATPGVERPKFDSPAGDTQTSTENKKANGKSEATSGEEDSEAESKRKKSEKAKKAAETRRKNREAKEKEEAKQAAAADDAPDDDDEVSASDLEDDDDAGGDVVDIKDAKKAKANGHDIDVEPFKECKRLKPIIEEFERQGVETPDEMVEILLKIKPDLPFIKRMNDGALPSRIHTAYKKFQDEKNA
jgi:hypothetical protein